MALAMIFLETRMWSSVILKLAQRKHSGPWEKSKGKLHAPSIVIATGCRGQHCLFTDERKWGRGKSESLLFSHG